MTKSGRGRSGTSLATNVQYVLLELSALADVRPVREVVGAEEAGVGQVLARPVDGGEQFEVVGVGPAHGLERRGVRDGRARQI